MGRAAAMHVCIVVSLISVRFVYYHDDQLLLLSLTHSLTHSLTQLLSLITHHIIHLLYLVIMLAVAVPPPACPSLESHVDSKDTAKTRYLTIRRYNPNETNDDTQHPVSNGKLYLPLECR